MQFDLGRPGAAVLAMKVEIGLGADGLVYLGSNLYTWDHSCA